MPGTALPPPSPTERLRLGDDETMADRGEGIFRCSHAPPWACPGWVLPPGGSGRGCWRRWRGAGGVFCLLDLGGQVCGGGGDQEGVTPFAGQPVGVIFAGWGDPED